HAVAAGRVAGWAGSPNISSGRSSATNCLRPSGPAPAVAEGRQTLAMPILEEFKAWLDCETQSEKILPKSPLRAAFTYTLNQWEALSRYTTEGFLSYDNNIAERLVKIPAIGRKNYLFAGSEKGRQGAAAMYSLVS